MAKSEQTTSAKAGDKLDDIMLAMDVVDTLRHEQLMVQKDLAADDRRTALIERLRRIYSAQGIEVPDAVLMDGVVALEEQRFAYVPPKLGFQTKLARLYINRRTWMPLITTLAVIIGAVFLINYAGFVRPAKLEAQRTGTLLTQTYPQALSEAREKALGAAQTPALRDKAENLYAAGQSALSDKDPKSAAKAVSNLEDFSASLNQAYTLRIISRPGELSGVFRLNDDGGTEVRNYYLIVEAIAPSGEKVTVRIESEEDQKTAQVSKWGVRVPKAVFNRVAADKRDDQIIQKSIVGEKKRGFIDPDYVIETSGGQILEW